MTKQQAIKQIDRLWAKAEKYAKWEQVKHYKPPTIVGWDARGDRIIRRAIRLSKRHNI